MITSNHVHLMIWTGQGTAIPLFMQFTQGEFAQQFNLRKKRHGSFWQDRYHATLIQDGNHLSCCLFYLAFKMVRTGAVEHLEKWKHCGYHELIGFRQRYRIVNINRLLKCLRIEDSTQFRDWYVSTIEKKVEEDYHHSESFRSRALAVGDQR